MKLYPSLSPELAAWLLRQPIFFTATAPLAAAHVNVSPKGLPASHLAVLGPNRVAYVDRTGSGCETVAHAYENGRLTLMFLSFGATPRILRLFCRARVVEWDEPEFQGLVEQIVGSGGRKEEGLDGARAVVVADVFEVQTSCGYGVPRVKRSLYVQDSDDDHDAAAPAAPVSAAAASEAVSARDLERGAGEGPPRDETSVFEDRPTLEDVWRRKAAANAVLSYQAQNNAESMDGLPGLRTARRQAGERRLWVRDARARARRAAGQADGIALGFAVAVLLYALMTLTARMLSSS